MMSFEAFSYPTSLHSLTNNVLEEESRLHITMTLMDVTMVVFPIFLRYKKINKIKFIEIIENGTHLSKSIIINLPRMKRSNQIMDIQ